MSAISWEKNHPERATWSDLCRKIVGENLAALEMAKDIDQFGAKYGLLGKAKRIEFWCEVIAAMAYEESGWNPKTDFEEPAELNYEHSIGLMQLSYTDGKNYRKFAKYFDAKTKSLENPLINLEAAILIMAYWTKRDGVLTSSGSKGAARYWSCLRPKRKLPDVIKRVKANFKPT